MGKAAAFLAVRLGASVAICGRDEEKLKTTQAAIYEATGTEILTQSTNIRDPEAVEELIATVHDRLGGLDTLVNNAGGQFPQDANDLTRKGARKGAVKGKGVSVRVNIGGPRVSKTKTT